MQFTDVQLAVLGGLAAAGAASAPDLGDPTIIPLLATSAAALFGALSRVRGSDHETVSRRALDGGFVGAGLGLFVYLVVLGLDL